MKVLTRQTPGYSEKLLSSMLNRTKVPSVFFDQPVNARGVCFAAGPDSPRLARDFAGNHLALGVFSISSELISKKGWREVSRILVHPQAGFSRIGIILPQMDLLPADLQEQVTRSMMATGHLLWFPTASNFEKLIPAIRLALVVYLGLNREEQMKILIQSGQVIVVDKDGLKRAPRPNLN